MAQWWDTMPVFEKIYWFIAIPSSVIFLLQLVLTFVGLGEVDEDFDGFDNDFDGVFEGTFELFTVKNFLTFFTVFGWSGIALYNSDTNQTLTVVLSAVIGIIVMLVVAALFYFIMRLSESGNMDIKKAIGHTGRVYIPIPAKQSGTGKIHITFEGNYKEMRAVTKGNVLKTSTQVKVVDVADGNIVVVEKI